MEKIELKRGDRGLQVKLIQEWSVLHGILIDIDGDFGPATECAVRQFQEEHTHLVVSGVVDEQTMKALTWPLERAKRPVVAQANVGLTVVEVAKQHLREHPRECGGENRGPWVRHYCQGMDGKAYAWCAGFVCAILAQAYKAHKQKPPFPHTLSCDKMAKMNAAKLMRVEKREDAQSKGLRPGAIFMIRKTPTDWTHTGIVTKFTSKEIFKTIEGNTTQVTGSREGVEVCARIRGYSKKDFIPI